MAASEKQIWSNALCKLKQKCTADGTPFNITTDYIVGLASRMVCEVTGRTLKRGGHTDSQDSPSIRPAIKRLGYCEDNVIVMSKAVADTLDAFTLDELIKIMEYKVKLK